MFNEKMFTQSKRRKAAAKRSGSRYALPTFSTTSVADNGCAKGGVLYLSTGTGITPVISCPELYYQVYSDEAQCEE